MKINEALILAGGKGERLISVTKNLYPKPLVEIGKELSLLKYTVNGLKQIGINKIFISVGFMKDKIMESFSDKNVDFVIEDEPLGTGGAIVKFISEKRPGTFIVTPVDNYIEWAKLKDMTDFEDEWQSDFVANWAVSSFEGKYWQEQVRGNIWRNKQTGKMAEYLSRLNKVDRDAINTKYRLLPEFECASSMGVVAINPDKFTDSVKILIAGTRFCLYKDLCHAWLYGNKGHEFRVQTKKFDVEVIDVGTPERLEFIRHKLNYG
jgi:molybdopterin-guanine dinucleotide biosynthesis protein A